MKDDGKLAKCLDEEWAKCPSCGVSMIEHDGLYKTCAKLIEEHEWNKAANIRARDFELMLARLCRALRNETFEAYSPAMKRYDEAISLLTRKGTASPLRK